MSAKASITKAIINIARRIHMPAKFGLMARETLTLIGVPRAAYA